MQSQKTRIIAALLKAEAEASASAYKQQLFEKTLALAFYFYPKLAALWHLPQQEKLSAIANYVKESDR